MLSKSILALTGIFIIQAISSSDTSLLPGYDITIANGEIQSTQGRRRTTEDAPFRRAENRERLEAKIAQKGPGIHQQRRDPDMPRNTPHNIDAHERRQDSNQSSNIVKTSEVPSNSLRVPNVRRRGPNPLPRGTSHDRRQPADPPVNLSLVDMSPTKCSIRQTYSFSKPYFDFLHTYYPIEPPNPRILSKSSAPSNNTSAKPSNSISKDASLIEKSTRGAIVSTWYSPGGQSPHAYNSRFKCQIATHRAYCQKHGYQCYIFYNTAANEAEATAVMNSTRGDPNPNEGLSRNRNSSTTIDIDSLLANSLNSSFGRILNDDGLEIERTFSVPLPAEIRPHWMKAVAIMDVLPFHPWVMYMDLDTVVNKVYRSPSLEEIIFNNKSFMNASVFIPQETVGWNSDIILVRNTAYGRAFIKHLWELRDVCPECQIEQCAVHVAMFHAMLKDIMEKSYEGVFNDTVVVERDAFQPERGRFVNCCNPVLQCEYPMGKSRGKRNDDHCGAVQGCIWNWQAALNLTPRIRNTTLKNIVWGTNMRARLDVSHPRKKMSC